MPLFPGVDYVVQTVTGPLAVLDNQSSPVTLFTLPAGSPLNVVIEYSMVRAGATQVGRLFVSSNGTIISFENDSTSQSSTGVVLSGVVSGPNILVQYISTATGSGGQFWYAVRNIS
jgi:hypothetical protein